MITHIYVTPNHYFPAWVNNVAHSYMSPAFHQAWDLFAPDPPLKEKSLVYRVKSDGTWTPWMDPGEALLQVHDRWRLSSANIEYRIHQNAAFRVWQEVYRAEEIAERRGGDFSKEQYILQSRGYRTARYYAAQRYAKQNPGAEPDSLQLRLIIGTPPDFPGDAGSWEERTIHFPKDAAR